jgi:rare lipoprotein A
VGALAAVLAASAVTPAAASTVGGPEPTGGVPAPDGPTLAGPGPTLAGSGPTPAGSATGELMPTGGALAAMPTTSPGLQPPASALLGRVSVVRGELDVPGSDRGVAIEVLDPPRGWRVAATGTANAAGAFAIPLRPERLGRLMLRATTARAATTRTSPATPTAPIEVYRPAVATIFGAGSYGTRTACGETLTPQLLGVAHLTLPCGTPVAIAYGGRSITVPVIDRGPYVSGRTYDLTTATARAIGFTLTTGVATIGATAGGR